MSNLFHKKGTDSNVPLFESWSFYNTNYVLFGIGVALIIVGYLIMAAGEVNSFQSLTLAPIMLFIAYIIVIPSALIYREKSSEVEENLGS